MGHGFGRGDDGMTDWRGGRVPKSSGEIRCLSYLDRAMAEMTWSRVMARDLGVVPCAACLTGMEEIVSGICAWLAAGVSRDWASDLAWCEASMEREGEGGETGSSEKRGFVDFGALGALGAALNLVRTSLRLAEAHLEDVDGASGCRAVMNRLSSLAFVLACDPHEARSGF